MAKRRPSGDGMVRKREDGRWEGRIVVGHKDSGDSIFRYVYADTQKELTAKLRKCITAYQGVDLTERSRITLSEWLDQWLISIDGTVRPSTLNGYRSYIENYIRPGLGEKRITQIKAADIQKFYDKLGQTLASGSVRRIHTTLHGIMKAAQQARLIPRNPVDEVVPPKFSYQQKQVLTDEQLAVFMNVIKEDEVWFDFFYTEIMTGLRRGEIQTISTDHCSFTLAQKDAGREDFTKIPGGLPGVETRGELIYSYGVAAKKLSLAQMCRVLSENPAKLYGLYPRKGVLAPGSDADIVVYDPGDSHVIRAEDCVANVDYNPYEGFVTAGGIREVWLRGRKTVENGKVLDTVPAGMYLARGKCNL